jgi:hypothetical protein
MTNISEIQDLVLDSLAADESEQSFYELLSNVSETRPCADYVVESLRQARDSLAEEDVFRAAYLYYENSSGYDKRSLRWQKEEALRLLFLFHDVRFAREDEEELRQMLSFLITRIEIRRFAEDSERTISYIKGFYEDNTAEFLAEMTGSKISTTKGWLKGANPTKSSRQELAGVAEVLYQLHEIKGWDKKRTCGWFEKYARADFLNAFGYFGHFFPHSVALRLEKLGLEAVGNSSWH